VKKTHGPDFRRQMKPLMECALCRGAGSTNGIFHQIDCAACNASGWICQTTGEPLPLEELVPQLSMRLRNTVAALARANNRGTEEQNNRRGAGGSHYTND
jgi:hypothetical protein